MKWPFYIYLYDVVVPLAVRFYCVNLWINRIAIIDPRTNAEPKCCDVAPDSRHPACWPIDIPIDDPFYSLFGRRCLEFVRSATGMKDQCKLGTRFHTSDSFVSSTEWIHFIYTGSRSTFNTVTSYLDASFVYGTSEETASSLRTNSCGLLKTNPVLRKLGLKDLLPPKLDKPDIGCKRLSRDLFCFEAGDARVNQQAMLVTLHTIFLREHNRIAVELSQINPHWNDERLFQV